MAQEQFSKQEAETYAGLVTFCEIHKDIETALKCSRCGSAICPHCMIQTPVGARCRICANLQKSPVATLSLRRFILTLLTTVVLSVAIGTIWGYFLPEIRTVLFLPIIVPLAVGYVIGESISIASNRKRTKLLAWMAGVATVSAFVISSLIFTFGGESHILSWGIMELLVVGISVYLSVTRIR